MSIKQKVSSDLQSLFGKEVVLEVPKDEALGDFATPVAFSLAREYKKSPAIIAEELKEKLSSSKLFSQVQSVKGFVNVRLNALILDEYANDILKNDYQQKETNNTKILLEFVSANPTGPLHIGHTRGAIIGEALYKIGSFLGYSIDKEYYVNDVGNQISLLGLSVIICYKKHILNIEPDNLPEDYYRGSHILQATKELLEENTKSIFEKENFQELCNRAKEKMLKEIVKDLALLNISFKSFISESDMYKSKDEVIKILQSNNGTYKEDEKIWLRSLKHGDLKDRVVLKEDGSPTYLAGDISYHYHKFQRGYDLYINIWGADHHGYIARVKSAIEFLGFDSNKLQIILSQMVSLLQDGKPYKMSKRKGNYITLEESVEALGADELKFIFLSKKCDTHLEFDVSELKKKDANNPIFYIQYAHTRISSLLRKSDFSQSEIINSTFSEEILSDDVRRLIINALMLEDVLINAFNSRDINKLTDFAYHLAGLVHSYYNNNKIIGLSNEKVLLKVLSLVAKCIKQSLSLMDIQAKDKM